LKQARRSESVVVLSSIDWDTAWQRHQIFAAAFAAEGRRVYFVENTGFRNPAWKDLPRLWRRLSNLAFPSKARGSNGMPAGVRILSPRVLPPTWPLFRYLNTRLLLPALRRELARKGLEPGAACVVYVPTATTIELIRTLEPGAVLYDCASNFRGHPQAPADFARLERELLSLCDEVVCDSDFLFEQKRAEHPAVEKIHQGVPEDFFRLPMPRGTWDDFVYYGTWSQDLDERFVDGLAEAGFKATVRGFTKGNAPVLASAVKRLAPVAREDLAASLAPYEGILLPYRVNPFLLGVIPAKIYECLATGRPVIATPLPSLKALEGLIYIGETPEDWVRIARDLPRTENAELRAARIAHAREHSAATEFRRFEGALASAAKRRVERAARPGRDAVMLSPVPWSRAPRARKLEAAAWADTGRRVFFVELAGERGFARRLRRALLGPSAAENAELPHGVELVASLFLPATRRLWRETNATLLAPRLADLLHDRGLEEGCAAILTGHSPHAAALLALLKPAVTMTSDGTEPDASSLLARSRSASPSEHHPVLAPPGALPAFVSGLGWIGILYGLAKASTLLTQIAAGRWLGPEEYGRASLVLAGSAYLQIAPMLGFPTAMGKFLASETDERQRARFVSTALAAFAAWTLLCLPVMAAAHHALGRILNLPGSLFVPSLVLATANAVYVVVASPLLGLHRFAHRGLVEAVYGLSAPIALLIAVLVFGPDHRALISALSAGFILGSAYALWCQRRYLVLAFEPKILEAVWRYAAVASLNLLAVACVLAPARFILHAVRSAEEVGLFSAYFTATIQVALAFLYMLQSVIVPMASDERGQRETWALVRKWAAPALAGAWLFFLAGLAAALAVFGRRYPMRWDWMLAFSASAVLALAHGTLSALYSARDFSGLRISVIGGLLAGAGNAALGARLIPAYGVTGAAAALGLSFTLGLAFFLAVRAIEGEKA
jgi:O-antigen/teichoic acid export membrane protein